MKYLALFLALVAIGCKEDRAKVYPTKSSITSSIYASGIVKSEDQYQVFAKVAGVVKEVYVEAGDTINRGDTLLIIDSEVQDINKRSAALSTNFYSISANQETIQNLKNSIQAARSKKQFDSIQYERQKKFQEQGIGLGTELERTKLTFDNSVLNYKNAINQYEDYKRQLNYNAEKANNNLRIAGLSSNDFVVQSEIDGRVYSFDYKIGEIINPQRAVAVIGSKKSFVLEMLIDEKDILKVGLDQIVKVKLDSYGNQIFNAKLSKIYPMMDPQTRTFKLEAEFDSYPEVLYPNMNFEANIVLQSKESALLVPREYVLNDSVILKANGDSVIIKTGLRDYQSIEVLSGIDESELILLPEL